MEIKRIENPKIDGERAYAYKKVYDYGDKQETYCIMFQWNAYYVARMAKSEKGTMCYTLRRYKTLSGAEKYLLEKVSGGVAPLISYEREAFIKKGDYWRK